MPLSCGVSFNDIAFIKTSDLLKIYSKEKKYDNCIFVDASNECERDERNIWFTDENIDNIETVLKPIEEITYEEIGDVDVVVCSRSLNGIMPIDEVLLELDMIADKYVFITVFGPENKKIEKYFDKELGIKTEDFPDYNYFFNILFNMGIYANIERFDLNNYREYESIEEAMDNGKFRLDLYTDEQKVLLKEYLERILTYENGKYYNVKDKSDWIMVWWKK